MLPVARGADALRHEVGVGDVHGSRRAQRLQHGLHLGRRDRQGGVAGGALAVHRHAHDRRVGPQLDVARAAERERAPSARSPRQARRPRQRRPCRSPSLRAARVRARDSRARTSAARASDGMRYERDTGYLQVGSPLTARRPPLVPALASQPSSRANSARQRSRCVQGCSCVPYGNTHSSLGARDRVVGGVDRRRRADGIHQPDARRCSARGCARRAGRSRRGAASPTISSWRSGCSAR